MHKEIFDVVKASRSRANNMKGDTRHEKIDI